MSPAKRLMLLSIVAACVTLALKFGAFWLTGSVSLYSDAMESFINLAAALVAMLVLDIAERPADEDHPWGHQKAEYFSSGLEGGLILMASLLIGYEAVHRLLVPSPVSTLGWGIAISMLASAINAGVALLMLRHARRHESIVLEADAHHLLTDVWTSVGVGLGLLVVMFAPPSWAMLDPIIALLVALNIMRTGWSLLQRSAHGLMDTALPAEEIARIETAIRAHLAADCHFGELKTRRSGDMRFVELKLWVPPSVSVQVSHAWCDAIELAISSSLGRSQTTIHVEPHLAQK